MLIDDDKNLKILHKKRLLPCKFSSSTFDHKFPTNSCKLMMQIPLKFPEIPTNSMICGWGSWVATNLELYSCKTTCPQSTESCSVNRK